MMPSHLASIELDSRLAKMLGVRWVRVIGWTRDFIGDGMYTRNCMTIKYNFMLENNCYGNAELQLTENIYKELFKEL